MGNEAAVLGALCPSDRAVGSSADVAPEAGHLHLSRCARLHAQLSAPQTTVTRSSMAEVQGDSLGK